MDGELVLNLGAGNDIIEGAVNHDLWRHRPEISVVHDLNFLPWPWEEETFTKVVARAVLEHLNLTLLESVGECWRILKPGGILVLKLPYWNHANSYVDVTHRWRFDLQSCDVFDPSTPYGAQYSFYTQRKWTIIKPARLNAAKSSFTLHMRVQK